MAHAAVPKSCYPHQRQVAAPKSRVATAKIRTLSHDGGVRIYLYSLHQSRASTRICALEVFAFSNFNARAYLKCVMNIRTSRQCRHPKLGCRHRKSEPYRMTVGFGFIFILCTGRQIFVCRGYILCALLELIRVRSIQFGHPVPNCLNHSI